MAEEKPILDFGQRKIYRIGSSYITSIPMEWIRKRGITAEDSLNVFLTVDDNILLRPIKEEEKNVRKEGQPRREFPTGGRGRRGAP